MLGFSGEYGYRQGQGNNLFGFGHWKGPWGYMVKVIIIGTGHGINHHKKNRGNNCN